MTTDGFPLPAGVEWTADHEETLSADSLRKAGVWRPGVRTSSGRLLAEVIEEIPEEIQAAKNCLHWRSAGCRPVPLWDMPVPKCDPWPHEGCIREYSASNYPLADALFYYP